MERQSQEGNATGHREYVDPEHRFTIRIPNGWLLDTSGQHDTTLIFFHPDIESGFRANVNVAVNDTAPLTNDEYVTLSRLELKRLTGFVMLPVDQPAPGNEAGHIFEWASDQQPIPIKARQRVVFGNERVFVVTATAFLGAFEKHRSEFEVILGSFASAGGE